MHKRLSKPRFLFVYPLAALLFAVGHITERNLRLGILLIALGEAVRLWANGYVGHVKVNWTERARGDAKIGRLITGGPYAFVRHPLYLGTSLIGAGFCLIVGNAWLALLAFGSFLFLYQAKMAEEEAVLLHEWDAECRRYHAAIPRLLPLRGRFADRYGQWSWKGVAASKEWKTAIWVTVLVILLYFWEEVVQNREPLLQERWVKHVCLLVVLVVLMATDGLAEIVTRRSRRLVKRAKAES